MATVEIYTTRTCPFCVRAKMLLKQKGVNFKEIDVNAKSGLRQAMTKRANGGYTVPQIFVDNKHVGGCDDLYALERTGKLDGML